MTLPLAAFLILIGFLSGVEFSVVFVLWQKLPANFFHINFVKIIEILIALFAASYIPFLINLRLSNNTKKTEFIYDLVGTFQKLIAEIYAKGTDYIAKPDAIRAKEILKLFQEASIQFHQIRLLKKKEAGFRRKIFPKDFFEKQLQVNFLEFKAALTGDPFGSKRAPKYMSESVLQFDKSFHELILELHHYKINLFV